MDILMENFIKYSIVSVILGLLALAACPSAYSATPKDLPSKGASGAKLSLVMFSEFH